MSLVGSEPSPDWSDDRAWYVVRSKPRREHFAQIQLMRRGIQTFLPRMAETAEVRSAPGSTALFPGYLFARIELSQQYTSVIWTPGVSAMVAFGDVPVPVEGDVIEFLQQRCGEHGILVSAPSFDDGQAVRVTGGPLAGLEGVVRGRVSGRDRVRVLMELLRRRTEVSVPVSMLECVAP